MRCLVTGATGFIGTKLVSELLRKRFEVNVLVRNKHKLPADFRNKIDVFTGDITNTEAVNEAAKNCDYIFHLAAFAGVWSKDKTLAHRTNVDGTRNMLEAAVKNNVKKVVFTSSAGTLAPSFNLEPVDETYDLPESYLTDYERTKRLAEQVCLEYCEKDLDVVIVNPTRVFGPGPLNKSNSVTILIKNYISGKWRFIPGNGNQIGNYVFIDDVVDGHIRALQYGNAGENYLLGGENVSYNELFKLIGNVSGKNFKLFRLPNWLMHGFSKFELFCAETFGKPPLITPPWVKRYNQNRLVSSQRAIQKLGYSTTPLKEGIDKTISWLNSR